MIRKFVEVLKYLGIVTGVLIGVLSCENDFRNVGDDIVDNNIFTTSNESFNVIAYNRRVERNQTNDLKHYLLGVQSDQFFGKFEASIVAQLSLPVDTDYKYGLNAEIDTVIVDIPYLATLDGKQSYFDDEDIEHSVPNFVLDSIWPRDYSGKFTLNVFELGTYLSAIDSNDPTKPKKYYSDDYFDKINPTNPLYSGLVAPNPNDTMLVVKRYKDRNSTFEAVYQTDTIKKTESAPSLKIPFNRNVISPIFQANAEGSEFINDVNFQHFFRGLYFESLESNADNSTLMTLDFSKASMTIYFSYDEEANEGEDEDLDGNGISGEGEVLVRTPNSFTFKFNGVKTNLYKRDYTDDLVENYLPPNADQTYGEDKLFVQGAAGFNAVIKLFGDDDNQNEILEMLRTKNWLINDAQLIFYIDQSNQTDWTPERLYLYHYFVNDEGEEEITQIIDAMPQSFEDIGGKLERNSDGEAEKYILHITEFISEIIKPDSEFKLYDLGLKVFDEKDIPSLQASDTILKEFDRNPKGIVLKGNKFPDDETRIKLDIYYSEKN